MSAAMPHLPRGRSLWTWLAVIRLTLGWTFSWSLGWTFGWTISLNLALSPPALADGAFPDSSRVLLPAGRPDQVTLATNFGLIATDDGGKTWEWSCETPLLTQGRFYQVGVPGRTVATSLWGVVRSDDDSCTWSRASGAITEVNVTDVFVNPAAPERALAIGVRDDQDMGLPQLAYASEDGGATFGAPIFRASGEVGLLGIESAASDPRVLYLASYTAPSHAAIARSDDAGATCTTVDVEPMLGPGLVRIVAVDPSDAGTIFLRLGQASGGEALAVSSDGGRTFRAAFSVSGMLTGFLRRKSGTILVAGTSSDGSSTGARSGDGGSSFQRWEGAPHLRGLAERDGVLYAAADDSVDGFALATSTDDGATWRPMLRYAQVDRIKPCVAAACARACAGMVDLGLWGPEICAAPAADTDTGPSVAGATATGAATPDAGSETISRPTAAGCSSAGPLTPDSAGREERRLIACLALAAMLLRRRAPRPPRKSGPLSPLRGARG